MGRGANIIISNFSDHVLGIGVPQHDYTSGWEALDQLNLQPRSGHAPVYIESTGITSNSYVTLSFSVSGDDGQADVAATARFRRTGDHWEVDGHTSGAVGVETAVRRFKQDVITIFLHPTVVTHHIRLHRHESGDRWECEMGSQGAADWPELVAETCTQTVSRWCRTVTLEISNACDRKLWLDVGRLDGSVRWQDEPVEIGAVWERSFDVTALRENETWEYQIGGSYDPPHHPSRRPMPALFGAPGGGPRRPLPDPTFKITRSGG
jgi:hypothetical protein